MRYGVIGGGGMASYHAHNLTLIPTATLVACAAFEFNDAIRATAQEVGATCTASVADLCARTDIDAVVIATPTDTHAQVALLAMQAGKHVLVEKPLARTLADAQLMLGASHHYGVKLLCGQVVRYFREYATAHQLITRGDIGTVAVARTTRCGTYPAAHTWYADTARSGGVALDLLIHDLDWLRWTFGEVTRVYARGLIDRAIPNRDTVMVILRFASGVIGYAESNWSYPSGFHTSLEVAGSNGIVAHRNDDVLDLSLRSQVGSGAQLVADPLALEDPYLAQLSDFTQWCAGGTVPRSTAHDSYEALRLSLAVLESIQTGRPVYLQGATA